MLRALETVGMEGYANRLIGDMSGGQQQRVMVARVLAGCPEIMLLDEPITGIDTDTASHALQSAFPLKQGKRGLPS